jgi:hypothetical protein
MQDIDPIKAQEYLKSLDKKYGKNEVDSEPIRQEPQLSQPNKLGWKNIPLSSLPSRGKYYLDGFEIAIKSATVAEIRHWSTIDETDMLSVDSQLNYILERCCSVSIANEPFSWKEILEVDRFYIILKIQELTFPNGENQLPHKFECTCSDPKFSEKLPITSSMLNSFDFPPELESFYSTEHRAYFVNSEKLNTSFSLYLPTLGTIQRLKEIIIELNSAGKEIDKSFIKIIPYLVGDWENLTVGSFLALNSESLNWHINKFTFISKFADAIAKAKRQILKTDCPKCGNKIESKVFLDSSFTVKDLFFISAGFSELV